MNYPGDWNYMNSCLIMNVMSIYSPGVKLKKKFVFLFVKIIQLDTNRIFNGGG